MRSLPSILVAFLVAGCAHSPAPPHRARDAASVSDGATTIFLRYGPEDELTARQLERAVQAAIPMARRWGALPPRINVTVHSKHEALEAAARRPNQPWLRAWARRESIDIQSPRSWSRGAATDAELTQLLAHELTHCVLSQALGSAAHRSNIPLWFWEGMATTTAGEHFDADLPASESLIVNVALDEAQRPYARADRLFRLLLQRAGEERIRQLVARVRDGAEFPEAFDEVMGLRLAAFERELGLEGGQKRTRG